MTPSLPDVGLAVKRLQWRHHRAANTRLAELGLSLAQWDVLRHLAEQPDASLHDLAQLTFQTDQSMGTTASRMVDRGLLVRESGPGRVIHHRLTPEGRRLRREGAAMTAEVLADSLGVLSERQLTTLHRLLTKAAAGRPD